MYAYELMRYSTRIYAHVTRMLRVKILTYVIRAYCAYATRKWSTNTQAGVYVRSFFFLQIGQKLASRFLGKSVLRNCFQVHVVII